MLKPNGKHCDGPYIKECRDGSAVGDFQDCRTANCTEYYSGEYRATCGAARFCFLKPDGKYCDGPMIKTCSDGSETMETYCRDNTCQEYHVLGLTRTASCGDPRFCALKPLDGDYCDGPYTKTCSGQSETAMTYCGVCSRVDIGVTECGTARYCTLKGDGTFCDGDILKRCASVSSTPQSQLFCEGGCVEWRYGVASCGRADDSAFIASAHGHGVGAVVALVGLLAR
mmetsp:Transcript_91536/g.112094  ORF Transcript_91536/g.112094 Transcript_91536/m.112094 type:complete len:227 (-) Transcript_91536:155-835(-)